MLDEAWIVLEDTSSNQNSPPGLLFRHPIDEVVCWHEADVSSCLQRVDAFKRQGYFVAGFISYEASYVLTKQPRSVDAASFPLLHFLVFRTLERVTPANINQQLTSLNADQSTDFTVAALRLNITAREYQQLFHRIQQHILDGDVYQLNLTAKYMFDFCGSALGLYRRLRRAQQVAYAGVLNMGAYQILTLSPELFFSKKGSRVQTKPMKGTAKRGLNAFDDEIQKKSLSTCAKNRSENIMIVDLLRNDLAVFSKPGSITTPKLFEVETFQSLHQMVSTVESDVDEHIDFATIINALFPCGSITGAPKRRTVEIIAQLEHEPRRIYTGAIGYILPNNDMCFNVAIRTVLIQNGCGELGVGGGVVNDSTWAGEFAEMQLKAQFFSHALTLSE